MNLNIQTILSFRNNNLLFFLEKIKLMKYYDYNIGENKKVLAVLNKNFLPFLFHKCFK